ncbi:hypothetical protein, partial [Corynebacterium afermentans]|uniref:hypothetical protein n=1 Tax=Corynebacterium afermentans TaxID=38286 RepID=UPI00257225D9
GIVLCGLEICRRRGRGCSKDSSVDRADFSSCAAEDATATADGMRRMPHNGRVVRYANIHLGRLAVMERFVMTQTRHIDAGISEYISTGYIGLPASMCRDVKHGSSHKVQRQLHYWAS